MAAQPGCPSPTAIFKTGSVGAIAVADSDPNVIYVGHGRSLRARQCLQRRWRLQIRGCAARPGATSACRTAYHIGAVRVHPKNPDIVYVAALGHLWGPNEQRGVYRSTDGGATWKQVLTRGPDAGAVDLAIDPSNPRVALRRFLAGAPQSLPLR